MIIEAFEKGTCFRKHYETFYRITRIDRDGGYFILAREDDGEPIYYRLDVELYELRVVY